MEYGDVKYLYLSTALLFLVLSFLPKFLYKFFYISDQKLWNLKYKVVFLSITFVYAAVTIVFVYYILQVDRTFEIIHADSRLFFERYFIFVVSTILILGLSSMLFKYLNKMF